MSIHRDLNLWQMKSEYQNLLPKLYDHETGEINEEVDAQLAALTDSAENKCIALTQWIESLKAEQQQIEYMEKQIVQRKAAYQKEIQKRYDYLENNMKALGIKEIKCPYFTLKLKNNPYSTDIHDESLIPTQFIKKREITEMKPDKVAIKEEVLRSGQQVPGAYVYQKTKLEILINKI